MTVSGAMAQPVGLNLLFRDVTGQRRRTIRDAPVTASVGEIIQGLLPQMQLPPRDTHGRPLTYQARLEREGRHLHTSEVVGDALQTEDEIVLQPNIDAGR